MKQSKASRLADRRIDEAYRRSCSGIAINIMDIGKVFTIGRAAIARGENDAELAATLLAFVRTISKEAPR